LGCDQTIWQHFGNNTGDVSPMRLQCYRQKRGDVTACQKSILTVSPTCFQRHADGRRAGLKARSSQEGVGSSSTFGPKTNSPPDPRKGRGAGRTAAQGGVPRMNPLRWRIRRSIADDDA
jgi:hypothetical protein